ncbi:MAG TPA: hypothetical protein DC054_01625 [Blastocatellia bacterium]|nr:hypothetical protein [Blastocatellia bacterium]
MALRGTLRLNSNNRNCTSAAVRNDEDNLRDFMRDIRWGMMFMSVVFLNQECKASIAEQPELSI